MIRRRFKEILFLCFVFMFCTGNGLFAQSRIPEAAYNWIGNGFPLNMGDKDQVSVYFFEVPDTISSTLYFGIYDASVNTAAPDYDFNPGDTHFYLIGGSGALSDSTSQQLDYTADRSQARTGTLLSDLLVTGADVTKMDNWTYFPQGVSPTQGEHIGNKYYFKVVVEVQSSACEFKNCYQLDISYSNTGAPSGVSGVKSFAYSWTVAPLDSNSNTFSIYPFIPESANATSSGDTDYIFFNNFDFDDQESLAGYAKSGYTLAAPIRSTDDTNEYTPYNLFDTEAASANNERNGTWSLTITEDATLNSGGNLSEVWFNIDTDNAYGGGTLLRAYSSAITNPPGPDHVVINTTDGEAMADGSDTEFISLQIVDSAGDPVNTSKNLYITVTDLDPQPAVIQSVSAGTNNSSSAIVTTDNYGYGSFTVRRNNNADADDLDTLTPTFTVYWDGSGGTPGNSDSFGTATSDFVTVDFIENPDPEISSAANLSFNVGDVSTAIGDITVTHNAATSSPKIQDLGAGAGELQLVIPVGVDCEFDTGFTGTLGVTGTGTVNAAGTFSDARTFVIEVTSNFALGDVLTISGLQLQNFGSFSNGRFELSDVPTNFTVIDDKLISIADPNIDYIWNGETDTSWNTTTNWAPNGTPGVADQVLITSGPLNQPVMSGDVLLTKLTVESGASLSTGGNNLTVSGDIDCDGTINAGGAGIITGQGIITLGTFLNGAGSTLSVEGAGDSSFQPNGASLGSVAINKTTGTDRVTLGGILDVNGNLTVTSGILDVSASDYQVSVSGNWSGAGTFDERTGTVIFDGTGNVPAETFYNLTVSNGTRTALGILTVSSNLVISGGILTAGGAIGLTGDFTLSGGTFTAGAYTHSVGGDWDDSGGTFTPAAGTITMTGAAPAITQGATNNFFHLTVNNTGTLSSNIDVDGDLNIAGSLAAGSYTIDVAGTWINSGTFTAGTGTVIFDGTGNVPAETFYNLTVSAGIRTAGGILTIGGNLVISGGTLTAGGAIGVTGGLTLSGGIFTAGAFTHQVGGSWLNSGGTLDEGTGTIDLTGTGNVSAETFYNLTLSGGTRTGTGAFTVTNSLSLTGGTFVPGNFSHQVNGNWDDSAVTFTAANGTIVLTGAAPTITQGASNNFYHLTITNAGTLASNIDVNRNLTIDGSLTVGAFTIEVVRHWINNGTFNEGTGTVIFNGNGNVPAENFYNLSITNGTRTATGALTVAVDFTFSGGTFAAGTFTHTVNGLWSNTGGTFNAETSTVDLTGTEDVSSETFYNLTLSGGTRTALGALTVTNALSLTGGTFVPGGFTHQIAGNWDDSAVTFTPAGGTIILTGTNPTITQSGTNNFFNLTLNVGASLASAIDVNGNLDIVGGTFSSNNYTIETAGNWTDGGTFNEGTGTVIFDGTGNVSAETFYNLTLNGGVRTSTAAMTVTNGISFTAGEWVPGGNIHLIAGNWDDTNITFTPPAGTGEIRLTSAGASVTQKLGNNFGSLRFGDGGSFNSNVLITGNLVFYQTLSAGANQITVAWLWQNSGTFEEGTSTVIFNGTGNVTSETFYNLTLSGGDRTATGALTVTNALSLTGGTFIPGVFSHQIDGNWNDSAITFTPAAGEIIFTGTNPAVTANGTNNFFNLTFNNGGSLSSAVDVDGSMTITTGTLTSNDFTIEVAGDWSNGGTFDEGTTGTVVFDGTGDVTSDTFVNLTLSAGTRTALGDLTVSGALSMTGGTFVPAGYSHQVAGNWDDTSITFTPTAGEIILTGTNPTITASGTNNFFALTVNNGASLSSAVDIDGALTIITGTLTSNDFTIEVAGDWSNGGIFDEGTTGTVIFDGTGTVTPEDFINLTISTGTRTAGGYLTAGGNLIISGGTLTAGGSVTVTGDFTLSSGAFTAGAFTHQIGGSWLNSGGTCNEGTSTFDFTGTGNISAETFYNLSFSGGTRTATGALIITNSLSLTGGTFVPAGFTHQINGNWNDSAITFTPSGGTISLTGTNPSITAGGTNNFFSLTLNNGASLSSAIDVNGNLNISAGTFTSNNYTIETAGDWTNSGAFTEATGTVIFDGTGNVSAETFYNLTLNGGTRTAAGNLIVSNGLILAGGTFVAGTNSHEIAGNWDDTAVVFQDTAGTVTLTSAAPAINQLGTNYFFNLTASNDLSLNTPIQLAGSLTFNGTLLANNNNLTVAGNWINNGTFTEGTSTVIFSGTGQIQNPETFYNLEKTGGGTTTTLNAAIEVDNDITITNGTLSAGTNSITSNGIDNTAVWTNTVGVAGFNAGTGEVIFHAATTTINGDTRFYNFTCTNTDLPAGRTIEFQAQSTQRVDGFFQIDGSAGNLIALTTTAGTIPGTDNDPAVPRYDAQWVLDVRGTALVDFSTVYCSYSLSTITATADSSEFTTPSYNFNWVFVIMVTYSETLDQDNNGKIDTLRVQTSAALNDVFADFTVSVTGYDVTLPCITGLTPTDDWFDIRLVEGSDVDTGATPVWYITGNNPANPLSANVGGAVVFVDNTPKNAMDNSEPVFAYTLAMADSNQIFVRFSEAVERNGGGAIDFSDFSYAGGGTITGATAVTASGNYTEEILLTLDSNLTALEILNETTLTATSAFQDVLDANPPAQRTLVSTTHRVSDLALGLKGNGMVEPLFAYDETTRTESLKGIGRIEKVDYGDFDGSGWLRDTNIALQAKIHDGLDGSTLSLPLHFDVNVSDSLKSSSGLWLPDFPITGAGFFNGLVPFPNEPLYNGANSSKNDTVVLSNNRLRNYSFDKDEAVVTSGNRIEFVFHLDKTPATTTPLYGARVGEPDSSQWFRSIAPWSFEIHDVIEQAGRVSILNNVINPELGERVDLYYVIEKKGPVIITVFTLAGDIVDILERKTRQDPGKYTVSWDGKNRGGRIVARGLYFIKVVASGIEEVRKVMVVK